MMKINLKDQNKPSGWEVIKLGDFVEHEKGKKPKSQTDTSTDTHNIPYIDIKAFEKNIINSWTNGEGCRLCSENDFLMVWDGSRSGLVGKGMEGALGSTLVRINFPLMENDYAYYYLESKFLEINTRAKGVGIPHVDPNLLWNYDFSIPPTNEQRRIVAKIEELFSDLDKGVESLKLAQSQLKTYRQSILKHAFEGKLTAEWRDETSDKLETADELLANIPAKRKQKLDKVTVLELRKFSKLPSIWNYTKLGSFIDTISAGKSFKCDEREPRINEIGVAKVSAVTWGEYNESESKTCTNPEKINPDYFIQMGDFIFSRANTIDLVGACVIAKKVTKHIMLSDKTLRIKFDIINPNYFLYYLRSQSGKNEIMGRSTGNQDSMRNIGQDRIRNIDIPICSPIEAKKIVEEIEAKFLVIDQLEKDIAENLKRSELLRQSILKKAFSGKLVAQDPNDEPASILLERIKAEKASQTTTKRKKRAS